MPQVDFGTASGSILAWAADLELVFTSGFPAGDLFLEKSGPDVIVSCGGASLTLSSVTVSQLLEANFLFQNGGLVRLGFGAGTDVLTGGLAGDYLNLTGGGSDSASGDAGDDTFDMGSTLDASDTLVGGTGSGDTVRLSGSLSVTLGATTITEVERIVWLGGGTLTLVLANATAATATGLLRVDGSAAGQADRLGVDASAVLTAGVLLIGGAGEDSLTGGGGADRIEGGEGADLLSGGAGNDTLIGGPGADTLTGGAGTDVFRLFDGFLQSDSSPTTIDLITDFEGLGLAGGDLLDLPSVSLGAMPFVLNAAPGGLLPEFVGDGLADITWSRVTVPGFTGIEVLIDTNDDGQIGEQDFLIRIATGDPGATLSELDFSDALTVWRGTGAADLYTGNTSGNTAYGVGGDDTLNGNGGTDTLYGAAGQDQLFGGEGNDQIFGGTEGDLLSGGDQDDSLYGGDGNDVLAGDGGSDWMSGGGGNDTLTGGDGADVVFGDDGLDDLSGGTGGDQIDGGADADTLQGEDGFDTLSGGEGHDRLFGGAGDDVLSGNSGADTLTGDAGADTFGFEQSAVSTLATPDLVTDFDATLGDRLAFGANGAMDGFDRWLVFMGQLGPGFGGAAGDPFVRATDGLNGSVLGAGFAQVWWWVSGGDVLVYADTNDNFELDGTDLVLRLQGVSAVGKDDFLADSFRVQVGDAQANLMTGTGFGDTMYGLGGADTLNGLDGANRLFGGQGTDVLNGGADADTLFGGTEGDSLYGGEGDNQLFGESGNDWLQAGAGSDMLWGGDGADTLTGDGGDDYLSGDANNDRLYAGDGNDNLDGGDGADSLFGGDGNDAMSGGAHADSLDGGIGDDTLWMDSGRDTLTGGDGADLFVLGNSSGSQQSALDTITDFHRTEGDLLSLGTAGQFDSFGRYLAWMGQLSPGFTGALGSAFALQGGTVPTLVGTFATVWWRAVGADVLVYIDVNDNLSFDSADAVFRLTGLGALQYGDFQPGTFLVQIGTDAADSLTGTDGNDTIFALAGNDTVVGLAGSDSLFGGLGADSLSGGDDADILFGGDDADTLSGDDGGDQLYGEAGNDSLYGGVLSDALWGGDGADRMFGGLDDDFLDGGSGNDSLYGEDGADGLDGSEGNDLLDGASGDDWLYGGIGNDTLFGGAGADTLMAGAGFDRITGDADADVFVVQNSSDSRLAYTDRVTDFQRATGDRLQFGANGQLDSAERYLVFMGQLANSFTGLDGQAYVSAQGLNPADLGPGFAQVWWRAGNGFLRIFVDVNDNLVLDQNDLVLRLDGVSTLSDSDFVDGNFIVRVGTSAADSLTGTIGTDRLYGFAGNDTLTGLDGNDWLYGGAGDDSILGGLEGDFVFGGDGADTLRGENGTDQLYGGLDGDLLDGGNDGDALWGEAGNDTVYGGFGQDYLDGGDGDDILSGGGDNDGLYGGDGNDTLSGNGGADWVSGDGGADTLAGNDGDDTLVGGAAADRLTGGGGADLFLWNTASDSTRTQRDIVTDFGADPGDRLGLGSGGIFTEPGRYLKYMGQLAAAFAGTPGSVYAADGGDAGSDIGPGYAQVWWRITGATTYLYVDVDDDFMLSAADLVVQLGGVSGLTAASFRDGTFTAQIGNHLDNLLPGGVDPDTIFGNGGADTLIGNESGDRLFGGIGADSLVGGEGSDTLDGGSGDDMLDGGIGDDQGFGGDGNDTFLGGTGGELAYGGAGDDWLDGASESDALYGDEGNDTITGGQAADYLSGGDGDDLFLLARASHFAAGEQIGGDDGWDVIRLTGAVANDNLVLTAQVTGIEEVAIAGATGDTSGTTPMSINASALGSAVLLRGNAGANRLIGTAYDDTLIGGLGADTLTGGAGIDLLSHETDTVGVTVNLTTGVSSGGTAAGDSFSGIENLRGGSGNDSLTGNGAANRLEGMAGADTLEGKGGNDTYVVSGADVIIEAANGGFDTVETGVTTTLGANLEGLRLTGAAAINGTGNSAANLIEGNGAANVLNGGGGNDTLFGGAGDDRLIGNGGVDSLSGGDGADVFVFLAPNAGLDTIDDFAHLVDRIEISGAGFGGLAAGALDPTRFAANLSGVATSPDHRFIYETDTGNLFYDADGNGAGARIRIAVLAGMPDLTAADIWVA